MERCSSSTYTIIICDRLDEIHVVPIEYLRHLCDFYRSWIDLDLLCWVRLPYFVSHAVPLARLHMLYYRWPLSRSKSEEEYSGEGDNVNRVIQNEVSKKKEGEYCNVAYQWYLMDCSRFVWSVMYPITWGTYVESVQGMSGTRSDTSAHSTGCPSKPLK